MNARLLTGIVIITLVACGGDDEPGTPDATVSDGGGNDGAVSDTGTEPDAAAPCAGDAECDDGVFCNGEEQCESNRCVAGTPPDLDDGVACTTESCDEDADMVVNMPDDAACSDLNRTFCDEAGLVTQDTGTCDVVAGCQVTTEVLDVCDTPPVCDPDGPAGVEHETYACVEAGDAASCELTELTCDVPAPVCTAGRLTTSVATCDDAAGCGVSMGTLVCAVGPPDCETPAGPHLTYSPSCVDGSTCNPMGTEMAEDCGVRTAMCSMGFETSTTPTCSPGGGCGGLRLSVPCDAAPTSCDMTGTLQHVRYFPACDPASPDRCLPNGLETRTDCLPDPSACVGRVYTTYSASCSIAGGCGSPVNAQDDCSSRDSDTCSRDVWQRARGSCTTGGCTTSTTSIDCAVGGSACTSNTTVIVCPPAGSCSGGTCVGCTPLVCTRGRRCFGGRCI